MKLTNLRILIFLCSFVFKATLIAQTVQIIDFDSKESIANAAIYFHSLHTENNQKGLGLTDSSGFFEFKTSEEWIIEIRHYEYNTIFDTLLPRENKTYHLIPKIIQLEEFVLTAQYQASKPSDAIQNIRIITSEKIEQMGAQNLRDVLTNELNIRLTQDQILGSSMNIQGISGQNVQIMIDGIPVIGRLNGNIDLSQINLNNADRIEIIEGPMSVNFGTDALGGTINIITKKTNKKLFALTSTNYYESIGQYNHNISASFSKAKNALSIAASRYFFDGWKPEDRNFKLEKDALADVNRVKSWNPKIQYFTQLTYNRTFKKFDLEYSNNYYFERINDLGVPRLPYKETAFDDRYSTFRQANSIHANGHIGKKYTFNFVAAHNRYKRIKNTYFKDLTSLNQNLTPNVSDQDTSVFASIMSRSSIINNSNAKNGLGYEIGYDINHEYATGKRILDVHKSITDLALFSTLEYVFFNQLRVKPGIRISYNSAYQAPITPSLNLKFSPLQKDSTNKYSIRFSYTKGFRAPSIKELYFYFVDINHNIVGNKDLIAEQSHNFGLTGSKNKDNKVFSSNTQLSFFFNSINNMISLALGAENVYSYFNLDKFKTEGVSLSKDWKYKQFKFGLGSSIVVFHNQLNVNSGFDFSPEAKVTCSYGFKKIATDIGFFYKYTGKMPSYSIDSDNQIYKTSIQDFSIADCFISRSIWTNRLKIVLGAKNICNVKNITGNTSGAVHSENENKISVGTGRSYFVKLDLYINSKK